MKIEMKFPMTVVVKVFETSIHDALIKFGVYPSQIKSIEMRSSKSKEYPLVIKVILKEVS